MTTQEFSNAFDTLLNSYRDIKNFGNTTSPYSLELDEYEKSILLTQAQDIIVKSYFDRTLNPQGQGFDETERRQIDFSELITINKPSIKGTVGGITLSSPNTLYTFKVNAAGTEAVHNTSNVITITPASTGGTISTLQAKFITEGITDVTVIALGTLTVVSTAIKLASSEIRYDDRSSLYLMPTNVLFMLNEKIISGTITKKTYIIVPINYKEYDRMMSKPFGQPLKKQCWRLFQNVSGIDLYSELIPVIGVTIDDYIIRYVKRPRPIVLTDLTQGTYSSGLTIDGVVVTTECELNPIIHVDILNKAVELAFSRFGASPKEQK